MCPLDVQKITKLCYETFEQLPKTGKPSANEWTVLASILQYNQFSESLEVVSLGTGTKCLSQNALSSNGDKINDSHAEVMARRGFLRYLYDQMEKSIQNTDTKSTIFTLNMKSKKYKLHDHINFHFFTSHPPCGDASIFEMNPIEPKVKRLKMDPIKQMEDYGEILPVNQTGSRLINTEKVDTMAQDLGEIRTKPGRGIRTLSVSCSDKLSKWNVLGIQGALISNLVEMPIYINSFTVTGDVEAMERALWLRWSKLNCVLSENYEIQKPKIRSVNDRLRFKFEKSDCKQPCSSSIVWCRVDEKPLEVSVNGKRQGITKSKTNSPSSRLIISKYELFKKYLKILKNIEHPKYEDYSHLTYLEAKKLSVEYLESWKTVKDELFKNWTTKPDNLNDFMINDI